MADNPYFTDNPHHRPFFNLNVAINRFAEIAAAAPAIQPLRQHAAAHGSFKQPMASEVTQYTDSEIEILPDDVIWRFGGHRAGEPYVLEIHSHGAWKLYRTTGGRRTVVADDDSMSLRMDETAFGHLAETFKEDMRKYLDFYVGAPAPRPQAAPPVQPVPVAVQQPAPSETKALIALIAAVLAIPLVACCIIPGYAACVVALVMSISETRKHRALGQPVAGVTKLAKIIAIIDIPVVIALTILLLVTRLPGLMDSGGSY